MYPVGDQYICNLMMHSVVTLIVVLGHLRLCSALPKNYSTNRYSASPSPYLRRRVPVSNRQSNQSQSLHQNLTDYSWQTEQKNQTNSSEISTSTHSPAVINTTVAPQMAYGQSPGMNPAARWMNGRYGITARPSTPSVAPYTRGRAFTYTYPSRQTPRTRRPSIYIAWQCLQYRFTSRDSSRKAKEGMMYQAVDNMFPGLFSNKSVRALDAPGRGWEDSDGDIHCPTVQKLVRAQENMTNINGQEKEVIHFPELNMYQFYHQGVCGAKQHQSCRPQGECLQQNTVVYLLAWKENGDFSFEPFQVSSYCSCRNIGF